MRAALVCGVLVAGCEPPPAPAGAVGGLSLEILYPEPGQTVVLDAACALTTILIVDIEGLDVVPADPGNLVDGEGHWHGGPDLGSGYCVSAVAFCVGSDGAVQGTYDGSDASAGAATLFASLRDNAHGALGVEAEVEIVIEEPVGGCP